MFNELSDISLFVSWSQDAFRAFHTDLDLVKKYLKPLHLGAVQVSDHSDSKLDADFRVLRETAVKMVLLCFLYLILF